MSESSAKSNGLFHYLNIVWLSYGLSCCELKSPTQKIILLIIRIVTHVCFIQQIVGSLFGIRNITSLYPTIYFSKTYLLYVIMSNRLALTVAEVLAFSNKFLSPKSRAKLIRLEKCLLILFVIWTIVNILASVANLTLVAVNSDRKAASYDTLNYWIETPSGVTVGSITYIVIFSLITVHFVDGIIIPTALTYGYLVMIVWTLKKEFLVLASDKWTPKRRLRLILTEINSVQDAIEKRLNAVPLLLFAVIFLNAAAVVTSFSAEARLEKGAHLGSSNVPKEESKVVKYVVYWIFELGIGVPVLVIPFLINWVNDKLRERFTILKNNLIKSEVETRGPCDYQMEKLIGEIENNLLLKFTGFSMFTLNREFVLGFISSLLTYIVLLLQISENDN